MSRLLPVMVILMCALIYSCASPEPVPGPDDDPRDGVYLYRKHCSRCHGVLTRTQKPGRRPARIRSAIHQNIGGMAQLRTLQDEDIVMIADALMTVSPLEDVSGGELYSFYCGDCHRPLNESDIAGKGYGDIVAAMDDVMCNTVNLKFLGDNGLRKIADALETVAQQPARPEQEKQDEDSVKDAGFGVARFLTCGGVSEREPVGPAGEFGPDTERVYVFLEAREVERNMNVYFVWYLNGVEAGRDRIKLGKSARWRTYCYKTINGGCGDWRVELHGPDDANVGSLDFRVTPPPAE